MQSTFTHKNIASKENVSILIGLGNKPFSIGASYFMETKKCFKCNTFKPKNQFYSNKAKTNGVQSDCIDCFKSSRKTIKPSTVNIAFDYVNLENEEWVTLFIDGILTDYTISSCGRFRNKDGKQLKYSFDDRGYPQLVFYVNRKRISRRVHRLVAQTFLYNFGSLPQVNHKDGNKLNMHYSNLEWCTCKQNVLHAWENGLNKPNFKK